MRNHTILKIASLSSRITANVLFFNVPDFIEAVRSLYQNVRYLIKSTIGFMNFTAVKSSVHQCSETTLREK